MTTSKLGLWTKTGQENGTEINFCISQRQTDITTLYLAVAYDLSVSNIVSSSMYDAAATHTFPNSSTNGPTAIYPPDITLEPGQHQTYWTFMSQLTTSTEPTMRNTGRSQRWCWVMAKGLLDHCNSVRFSQTCTGTPISCENIRYDFIELCHRVRSIDTSIGIYSNIGCANYICIPSKDGLELYKLSRV